MHAVNRVLVRALYSAKATFAKMLESKGGQTILLHFLDVMNLTEAVSFKNFLIVFAPTDRALAKSPWQRDGKFHRAGLPIRTVGRRYDQAGRNLSRDQGAVPNREAGGRGCLQDIQRGVPVPSLRLVFRLSAQLLQHIPSDVPHKHDALAGDHPISTGLVDQGENLPTRSTVNLPAIMDGNKTIQQCITRVRVLDFKCQFVDDVCLHYMLAIEAEVDELVDRMNSVHAQPIKSTILFKPIT